MAVMSTRRKHGRKVLYKYNKRRCTAVNSNVNGGDSNYLDTSNSDNAIRNSNLTHINVKSYSPFNKLITLQK